MNIINKIITASALSLIFVTAVTPFITHAMCLQLTISSNVNNYNVASAASAGGWVNGQPICLTINAGVIVGSTSPTSPALTTGSLPSGTLTITNGGSIIGAGGSGGHGGPLTAYPSGGNGGAGGSGGDAIRLDTSIYLVNVGSGKIIGGSGGGGGGAGFSFGVGAGWGGGGGAGGAGSTGGAGGAGGVGGTGGTGGTGSVGTVSLGGGGGGANSSGPGAGGTNTIGLGFSGANGGGFSGWPGFVGGVGGAAGNAITYNGFTASPPAGTINVSSNISSSWTITGPATITGSGTSQSSPSKPTGTYTITWGSVAGYTTPATQSLTLTSGGTITFNGNYVVSNTAPVTPTVSGPTTTAANTTQTYSFVATDPQSNQLRYGVDWNMDSTADYWSPYVNSGTSRSTTYSWSTAGTKTFQVLAQDAPGLNSPWRTYTVTVTCSNGTNNPPTCTQCPDNQAYQSTNCVLCSGSGGCTGPGGSVSNPNGGLVCNNGALTPAYCADCGTGEYYTGTSCIACSNGGCSGSGAGLTCNNGNIDPPACATPPAPTCNNDNICGPGETLFNCSSDCKAKYQQF